MRRLFLGFVLVALANCKPESPAGTVVADWSYEITGADPHAPASKQPPKIVTSTEEWPSASGIVKLRFETEIGDLASDVHWDWPKHIRITLAEPTRAKLPQVNCMSGPPGNKVVNGQLVRPVGHDGVTPSGLVACFVEGGLPNESYVFDVDGDGQIKRNGPSH